MIHINLDDLYDNYKAVARLHPDKKIIAVIKANAYGMGAVSIAEHLGKQGVDFFAVATLDEALELRKNDITAHILVLGVIRPEDVKRAAVSNIAVTLPDEAWLAEAIHYLDRTLMVHVKLDTGMNRIGIRDKEEYGRVLERIKQSELLDFEGVYTHFSCADMDNDSAEKAYEVFMEIVKTYDKPRYIHSQNSAAALRYKMADCTAVRLGIAMYGYYPSPFIKTLTDIDLKPVMKLTSEINFIKDVPSGTKIGYGSCYEAEQNERIATLPIGYADGLLRSMSGYSVRVAGEDAPIVGRVCMDQTMIRVSDKVNLGDEVLIIDNKIDTHQSMEAAEEKQSTISYEVLCNLGQRLPRVYYTDNQSTVKNTLLK